MSVKIFENGTSVCLDGIRLLYGTISAVCIDSKQNYITYKIVYWNGLERKVEWLPEDELLNLDSTLHRTVKKLIGFKPYGNNDSTGIPNDSAEVGQSETSTGQNRR